MAAFQLIAPMAALTLDAGASITFEAIDPDTGANVTGVTISSASVYGVNLAPDFDSPPAPSDEVPPLFVPIPQDAQ